LSSCIIHEKSTIGETIAPQANPKAKVIQALDIVVPSDSIACTSNCKYENPSRVSAKRAIAGPELVTIFIKV
jgi:hypothetical protein